MAFESMLIRNVQNHYGTRGTDLKFGSKIGSVGQIKTAQWVFDWDDLPVAAATNQMVQTIPSGSYIIEAYFSVITAFAGGTDYNIDLQELDGTAIGTGTDKMWDALLLTDIDASEVLTAMKSSTHTGTNSGNIIGTVTDAVGQLEVIANGAFTAGRGRIILEYLTVPAA